MVRCEYFSVIMTGEVKEKAKARKEYKEAVAKGHGAYLMEEETPVCILLFREGL